MWGRKELDMTEWLVLLLLARSKHLLILWLQSQSAVILEPKKIKFSTVSIFYPIYLHDLMGTDTMILVFWMLSLSQLFHSPVSLSFSSCSLSIIRVVSSAYLRLLIFLWAVLNPAYESSSLAFHMMYSAYGLNKEGDNIQPWCTPFPILNQSVAPCPVLMVASLTCIQIFQEAGKVVWYSQLFKNFPQFIVIHTVKGFSIDSEVEVDVY